MVDVKTRLADELFPFTAVVQRRIWGLTAAAAFALAAVTALGLDGQFHVSIAYPSHTEHLMVPLPSVVILVLYGVAIAWMLERPVWTVVGFVVIMGLSLQLIMLLAELFRGVAWQNPFRGARRLYGWYATAYGAAILGAVAYASGCLARRSLMETDLFKAIVAPFVWAVTGGAALLLATAGLWPLVGVMVAGYFAGWAAGNRLRWAHVRVAGERLIRLVSEKPALVAGGIFILALLVRLAFAWRVVHLTGPDFLRASDDGLTYGHFGMLIAQGKTIPRDAAFYWGGLGYWYFLGAVYRLFGLNNHLAVALVQAFCGAVVAPCAFLLGRWLVGPGVALGTGLLSALSMNLTFLAVVVGMEALFIPLMVVHLTVLIWTIYTGALQRPAVAFGLGAMLGVVLSIRIEVIYFPLVLAFVLCMWGRERFGLKKAVCVGVMYMAGFSALYLLICFYNWFQYGLFSFATAEASKTFSGPYGGAENQALAAMGFNPFDDALRSLAVLVQQPFQVLSLLVSGFVKRGLRFVMEPNFGVFDPVVLVNPSSGYVYRYAVALGLFGYVLLAVGLWTFARRKQLEHRLVMAYLLYTFFIYASIAAKNVRHRGVVMPLVYLCVAVGFVYGWQALQRWFGNIRTNSI